MRGTAKYSNNAINEKFTTASRLAWSLFHALHKDKLFADYYNPIDANVFKITDKVILDKYDDTNKYINKIKREYTWDWKKDFDNGMHYDFPTELMDFSVNAKGEIIASLTDLYLEREDLNIPTIKYSYFFINDANLMLTVPNQADDGSSIAYINNKGELIIDNTQY